MFVKDPDVSILHQIIFERFQLDDFAVRDILNGDTAEIGQTGHGTYGCEFRLPDSDIDVPFVLILIIDGVDHVLADDVRTLDGVMGCILIGLGAHGIPFIMKEIYIHVSNVFCPIKYW